MDAHKLYSLATSPPRAITDSDRDVPRRSDRQPSRASDEPTASPRLSVAIVAAGCFIAAGLAGRVRVFTPARVLDIDETMLALNIALRGFPALTHSLLLEQTAPLLFLWLSKASVLLFGVNEYALRLTPWLAGLGFIVSTTYASYRLDTPRAALLACVLASLSPIAIQYAATFKQYSVDAFMTALLLWLVLRVMHGGTTRAAWIAWAVPTIMAPLLSAPSVFVTGPSLAALFLSRPGDRRRVCAIGASWACVFLTNWALFQRATIHSAFLQHFWQSSFLLPPLSAALGTLRLRTGFLLQSMLTGPHIKYLTGLRYVFTSLIVVGLVRLTRRHGAPIAILCAGPFLALWLAAAIRAYPIADRTCLFLAPIVMVLMASGTQAIAAVAGPRMMPLTMALLGGALALPGVFDVAVCWPPSLLARVERSIFGEASDAASHGEPVYVLSMDVPRWIWYTTDWTRPDTARIHALIALASSTGPNAGNAPPRGRRVRAGEGDSLVYRSGNRVELVGIPTGVEILDHWAPQWYPDPGWVEAESDRIRGATRTRAWIISMSCPDRCSPTLVDDLLDVGKGTATNVINSPWLRVDRYAAPAVVAR